MSVAFQRVLNLITLSIGHVTLNPIVSGALLWILTKGPVGLRSQLTSRIAALRDPVRYVQILKALKYCLALGVTGVVNKQLNQVALNAGRIRSEKARWNWRQEVAVVTGGCSGIGQLVVKRLVSKGIRVAILDIQQLPPSLQGSTSDLISVQTMLNDQIDGSIKFFACDITDPSAVYSTASKIKETLGAPTILINNAGILASHTILSTTDDYLKKIFDVNVLSNWYTVKAFIPDMITANKGHIVTVASTASYVSVAGLTDYTATKAAILSFHEGIHPSSSLLRHFLAIPHNYILIAFLPGLNQELVHHYSSPRILTTSIHPNWVRTPLLAPVEAELKQRGSVIIEPEVVADSIVSAITSCRGGQVFLPNSIAKIGVLRGLPNWVQEKLRSGVSKTISESVH